MDVDQHVVVHDLRLMALDEANPAHVCREVVDLLHAARGLETIRPPAQIEELELLSGRLLVLGKFDVDPPHPVPLGDEELRQVVPDEATSTGNEHTVTLHLVSPLGQRWQPFSTPRAAAGPARETLDCYRRSVSTSAGALATAEKPTPTRRTARTTAPA